MNEEKVYYKKNARLDSSFWAKLTYTFAAPLLALGQKKQLQIPDLDSPLPNDESYDLTNQLETEWNKALKKQTEPSFGLVLLKWLKVKLFFNSLKIVLVETIKIFQPLLISLLLKYFSFEVDIGYAIGIGIAISACAIAGAIIHHPYYFNIGRYGMRLRLACSGLIYRKVLRMNVKDLDSKSAGDVINLLSSDVSRIDFGFYYMPYLLASPIQLIVVIVIVVLEVGWTFLAGIIIIFCTYPIKAIITSSYDSFRAKNCKKSDERVSVLTEILNSIKIIKMYCWEIPFTKKVSHLRNQELEYQLILNMLQALNATMDTILTTLVTLLNIIFFIYFAEKPLLPAYTVFAIGFYMRLCNSMGFNFTRAMIYFSNYRVSAKRVGKFLLTKELDLAKIKEPADKNVAIDIKDFTFTWNDIDATGFGLSKINLQIKKGELASIVGPIGSGKSTLLLGMLGELDNYEGRVGVSGKVFYVSQQPWVFTSSIRQNIIFGQEYNKEKFDKVVEACSLKKDLELLPLGESTLVGEKGINLSGGQRARICMARALYSDADIYLFDDTLSAVDGTVAKNIVKNCINGYLKDKTRVLVTHQVHHLESADQIFVLRNGNMVAQGTYNQLLKTQLSLLTTMEAEEAREQDDVDDKEVDENVAKEAEAISKEMKAREEIIKKEREETNQLGAVGFSSYYQYFTAGVGFIGVLLSIILFLSAQGAVIAADYWLSLWATDEERYENCINKEIECDKIAGENNVSLNKYLDGEFRDDSFQIYWILCAAAVVVVIVRSVVFYMFCVLNSKKVYDKLFISVRDTFIRFFELNPIGRILNRFSKDTNNMDEMLVLFLYEFIQVLMTILGALVVPSIVNPYVLIPLVPLIIVFYLVQRYFVRTGRQLKRLDNTGRSPIFIHTNSTIEGLSIIRVCKSSDLLVREFHMHCDNHTRAFFGFHVCHRWFGLRLDLLCSAYTIVTLFACIGLRDVMNLGAGEVGLLIVYLFQLFDLFQWGVVLSVYVETLMTSIERIVEYTNIKREPLHEGKRTPPENWPDKGEVIFKNVSLSYDKNLPNVLKNISLRINPAEKIGIVGRTGAGKSSFFQTIFRMYEPEGEIIIDGINIKDLKLVDLRTKLTIIPQEPVLFSGTVRYNLDPYGKYNDDDIWAALESVNLKEMVKSTTNGLDSVINSGGSNLSVGEKQLICLARAVLKKTKILIIDEATANVDYKTDQIIQKTIREQFKDCTVLTIAHRLATVVDSSRILCLSEGEVKNFDKPSVLLSDETSVLFELTKKLSPNEKKFIFDIAYGRTSLTDNLEILEKSKPEKRKSSDRGQARVNYGYYPADEEYEYNTLETIHF